MSDRVLVVLQENSGRLAFMPGFVPPEVVSAIEGVIDRLAETFEDMKTRLQAVGRYDRLILLTDDSCKRANLLDALVTETQSGSTIDLVILGHGANEWLGLKGEALTGGERGSIRTLLQEAAGRGCPALNVRLVYMCNCYGSTVNDDWRAIGARASVGSRQNNYMPEPMTTQFVQQWVDGRTAADAARDAYATASGIWQPIYSVLGPSTAVAESEPLVAGDAGVKFDWMYAGSGSREFDVQFYLATYPDLQAAFGTNYRAALDHWVNQGLPNEGRRGSREFDVQFYLATYPDLQAAFGTNYRAALDHWVTTGISEGRRGAP